MTSEIVNDNSSLVLMRIADYRRIVSPAASGDSLHNIRKMNPHLMHEYKVRKKREQEEKRIEREAREAEYQAQRAMVREYLRGGPKTAYILVKDRSGDCWVNRRQTNDPEYQEVVVLGRSQSSKLHLRVSRPNKEGEPYSRHQKFDVYVKDLLDILPSGLFYQEKTRRWTKTDEEGALRAAEEKKARAAAAEARHQQHAVLRDLSILPNDGSAY